MASFVTSTVLFSLLPFLLIPLIPILYSPLRITRSQLRHISKSFFAFPLLEIVSRFWSLHSFVPLILFTLTSIFVCVLSFTFLIHLLSTAFTNAFQFCNETFHSLDFSPFYDLLRPLENPQIPPSTQHAFAALNKTITDASLNLSDPRIDFCFHSFGRSIGKQFVLEGFSQTPLHVLFECLASCPSVEPHMPAINSALKAIFTSFDAVAFFNGTTFPEKYRPAFDEFSSAVRSAGKSVNFTRFALNGDIDRKTELAVGRMMGSIEMLYRAINFTDVLDKASASEDAQEKIAMIKGLTENPNQLVDIIFPGNQYESRWSVAREFLMNMPTPFRVALLALFLAMITVPFAYVFRAGALEAMKTVLTYRYKARTAARERDVSGWLRSGAISGLGIGLSEAVPVCAIVGMLASTGVFHSTGLLLHVLAVVPMHVSTQLRIAEELAREDVLKDGGVRKRRAFIIGVGIHTIVGMSWIWVGVLVALGGFNVWLVLDGLPVAMVVWWGRRICRRVLRDELRMLDEGGRKDE